MRLTVSTEAKASSPLSVACLFAGPDDLIRLRAASSAGIRLGEVIFATREGERTTKIVPLHLRPLSSFAASGSNGEFNSSARLNFAAARALGLASDETEISLSVAPLPPKALAEARPVEALQYRAAAAIDSSTWLPVKGALAAFLSCQGLCGCEGGTSFVSVPPLLVASASVSAREDRGRNSAMLIEVRPEGLLPSLNATSSTDARSLWKFSPAAATLHEAAVRLPAAVDSSVADDSTFDLKVMEERLKLWAMEAQKGCPGYEKEMLALLFGPVATALCGGGVPLVEGRPSTERRHNSGSCAVICGEAGTGKSRILQKISSSVPAFFPHSRTLSLHALDLVHSEPGASEALLKRLLRDRAGIDLDKGGNNNDDPTSLYDSLRFFDGASAAVGDAAKSGASKETTPAPHPHEQPFVLVSIDDAELLLPAQAARKPAKPRTEPGDDRDNNDDEDEDGSSFVSPLLRRLSNLLLKAISRTTKTEPRGAQTPRVCWLLATRSPSLLHPGLLSLAPPPSVLGLSTLDPIQRRAVLADLLGPFEEELSNREQTIEAVADGSHGMQPSDLAAIVVRAAAAGAALLQEGKAAVGESKPTSLDSHLLASLAEARASLSRIRNVTATMPPSLAQLQQSASDLSSLVGCDAAIDAARECMKSALVPSYRAARLRGDKEAASFPSKGLLITGSSGCGKSSLALALARDAIDSGFANALVVSATDIISPVLGASEAAIRRTIAQARALQPCVLVIDNLHVLAGAGAGAGAGARAGRSALNRSSARLGNALSPFVRMVSELSRQLDFLEWPESALAVFTNHRNAGEGEERGDDRGKAAAPITRLSHSRYQHDSPSPSSSFSFLEEAAARGEALLGRDSSSGGGSVRPEDIVLSSSCASVFIIAVAPSFDSISPDITRRGRIDTEIRLARPNAHAASALLQRLFFKSPLWSGSASSPLVPALQASMSKLCFVCGNRLHHAFAASTIAAAATATEEAWPAYLHVLACHLVEGTCGAGSSANNPFAGVRARAPAKGGIRLKLHERKAKNATSLKRGMTTKTTELGNEESGISDGGQSEDEREEDDEQEGDEEEGAEPPLEEQEDDGWTPARLKRLWEESAQNAIRRAMATKSMDDASSMVLEPGDMETALRSVVGTT